MTSPTDPNWAGPAGHGAADRAGQAPAGQAFPGQPPAGPQYWPQPHPWQPYPGQPYPGQPYPGQPYGWPMPGYGPAPRNSPGVAALTLGIIAVSTFWIPLLYLVGSIPCAIIAIVQGSKGRRLAAAGWATNPGQAKAGIICGTIALVLCAGNFAFGIWLVSHLG